MALPGWCRRYFGLAAASDPFARAGDERLVLHVGCGPARLEHLPPGFQDGYREVRLDIDAVARPDVRASITAMDAVPDGAVDAVFTSHTLEHLDWPEVPKALAECRRVLTPEGMLVLTVPDAQEVCRWVAEDRLLDVAYVSSAGPIAPMDMLWGHVDALARGRHFMRHRCGFTLTTLVAAVRAAGFVGCYAVRRPAAFDLWLLALPVEADEMRLRALAAEYLAPTGEA